MSIFVARQLSHASVAVALCTALPTASLAGDSIGLYDIVNNRFHLKDNAESGVADWAPVLSTSLRGELTAIGDWNGDGRDTVGTYDPTLGRFKLTNRQRTTSAELDFTFGPKQAGLQVVSGDWNGDGVDTVGVYDMNRGLFWLNAATGSGKAVHSFRFGPAGMNWRALAGDWDGDGTDTIGLYDPYTSTFHLRNGLKGGRADVIFRYGPKSRGWGALVGDWNSDGIDTVALYDPELSRFHLRNENASGPADASFNYGPAGLGWSPVAGQWEPEKPVAEFVGAAPAVMLLEAEDFSAHDARRGIRWQSVNVQGQSGRTAMKVLPSSAAKVETVAGKAVARLDYHITVTQPGRYYVLLRGMGSKGGQNSVHVGLDGEPVASAANIAFTVGVGWTWNNSVRYVDVTTAGPHVLNLWMREAGTIVDAIILTPSKTMTSHEAETMVLDAIKPEGPSPSIPEPTPETPPKQPAPNVDPAPTGPEPQTGDGSSPNSPSTGDNVSPGPVFQFDTSSEVASIEAENDHFRAAVGKYRWEASSEVAGFSGEGAVRAMPEDRTNLSVDYAGSSPRLDYRISFPEPGNYFVWVRGHGRSNGSNSVHVGLNGKAVSSGKNVGLPRTDGYAWSSGAAYVTVSSRGIHTLNIWMRESGTVVDRVLVTPRTLANPERIGEPSAPNLPTTDVALTWKPNSKQVDGYQVYFGTSSSTSALLQLAEFHTKDASFPAMAPRADFRSYEDLGLSPGDTACFRLRAFDKSGVSGFGKAVCVKI